MSIRRAVLAEIASVSLSAHTEDSVVAVGDMVTGDHRDNGQLGLFGKVLQQSIA